jgi:hypothetical protein
MSGQREEKKRIREYDFRAVKHSSWAPAAEEISSRKMNP